MVVNVKNVFGTWDYVVFAGMLLISSGIGIFFALRGGRQKTQGEYLMGNRSMPILPVAISILVSFMSAILILGTPAEMYTQGTEYYITTIGMFIGVSLAAMLFVPLFFPLKITSVFEYLECRFNSRAVRLVGTFLMIATQILYMGLASFAPSTAFQAVTGFPLWATITITGFIGTFYTCIGGMKAVIWTDVFQASVMIAGMLAIVVQGAISVGGFGRVWEINEAWQRIQFFNFDPNPTTRHTFWNLVVGGALTWTGQYGINQASVQRYCSLPTLNKARLSVLLNTLGLLLLMTLACISGIVLFAYYAGKECDPLGSKLVDNPNQLIPYFVMEVLGYPGVPGLFVSCLFSGALSTVSSSLNALAAITWEDMLKPHFDKSWSEYKKTVYTKVLVIFYGCLSIAMAFIATQMEGTVLQATIGLLGAVGGPLTGLFFLGAFFPWANSYGAIVGTVCGLVINLWLAIGSYLEGIQLVRLPYPNGTCLYDSTVSMESMTTTLSSITMVMMNTTAIVKPVKAASALRDFYTISYMWFSSIGIMTTIIVGLIASFITGANSIHDVPTKYQIPVFSRLLSCLPDSWLYKLNCCRNFQTIEDVKPDEKDNQIIKSSLNKESSLHGEKSGVDNEGFEPGFHGDKRSDELELQNTNGDLHLHHANGKAPRKVEAQETEIDTELNVISERL